MKAEFLLFAALLLTARASISEVAGTPQRRIVFARGSTLWTANLDGTKMRKLNGDLLASWEIAKIIPKTDMDSSKRFSVCQDGKKMLIDVNMDEEDSLKDWEGPPPATWLFDIPSGKATRLTPKKSYASDSCWLTDSEFLLVDADKVGKTSSIYRISIDGGIPRLLIRNGADPSVSRTLP